jgi:hypothetical protein
MSSLPEYFRPEHQRPLDSEGYELPEWENPYFTIPDQAEPSEEDCRWAAENFELPALAGGSPEPFEPTDADWDDYYLWSYGLFTDEDVAAAGLPVG